MVDWADTGAMLSGWGSLLGAMATAGGAYAVYFAANKAADTFGSWKRQKLTERRMDHAERILAAVYRATKALKRVRSPFMWAHEEYAARDKLAGAQFDAQPEYRQKRLVTAQAYLMRLEKASEDRAKLDEVMPLAQVLFSDDLEAAINQLDSQFWFVQNYVEDYVDHQDMNDELGVKIKGAMYHNEKNEEEEINKNVAELTTKIREICLPFLRPDEETAITKAES